MVPKSQAGSSLIEVMVALFVLAIGLLGVLAMQSKSMQYNQSANTYAQAVYIANDVVERIRSNSAATANDRNSGTAGVYPQTLEIDAGTTATAPAKLCQSSTVTCNSNEIVLADQYQLHLNILRWLPGGALKVEKVIFNDGSGNGDRYFYKITVSFDDTRSSSQDKSATTVTPVTLNYTLMMEI